MLLWGLFGKIQPLLMWGEQFMQQHQCKLAAKESGLACTCVNSDNFTVLVSGVSRHCSVSICTVWLSHSKWMSEQSNESASSFALSLNIPPWKLFRRFRRPQLWASGDWQLHHDNVPTHAARLVQGFLVKHQIIQVTHPHLQPRLGTLRLLAFPKTKITFERAEILDHQWDSGK